MDRAHARRIFEEAIATVQRTHAPMADVMVEARADNEAGESVVVARYKLYTDGRFECFQVLNEVLWPPQ